VPPNLLSERLDTVTNATTLSPTSKLLVTVGLENLERGRDHDVLFELAESGSTDYLALPIEYGDGSVQGERAGRYSTRRSDECSARSTATRSVQRSLGQSSRGGKSPSRGESGLG